MKSKIHTFLIYPLIFLFSCTLKGNKKNYKDFFSRNEKELAKLEILKIQEKKEDKNNFFLDKVKYFFDKESPLYDKTQVDFEIDLSKIPEKPSYGAFTFIKKIDMYYSMSMLSKRIANDRLLLNMDFTKVGINNDNIYIALRYCLLVYASRKVDIVSINTKNDNFFDIIEVMKNFLDNSEIINYSNAKDLHVINCKNKGKKFDVIWSSSDREIELTDFDKVYDKFGNLLKKNIVISKEPIYAYQK